jgi:hypothetical protein
MQREKIAERSKKAKLTRVQKLEEKIKKDAEILKAQKAKLKAMKDGS